jgi:phospholipid/cholesterol/gamma-HCH transport system substrate-binding protein
MTAARPYDRRREAARRRLLEVVFGIGLSVVLVAGVVLVWDSFRGNFSNKITVSARLAQAGDALEVGDIVTYHDVIVGEVTAATGRLDGGAVTTLRIDPQAANVIPAAVTAVAVPESLFGLTRIELVPPGGSSSGPMLRDGDVIPPDRSPAAESLQTALANAYTLLTSVHPAQLDAALSSLATALDGQGRNLGTLVAQADRYLRALAPQLPALDDTIRSLASVADDVAQNAPQLVDTLRNTLVVSRAILADKQAVAALLGVAPAAVDHARGLLTTRTVDNAVTVIRNEGPVLNAFGADPTALPRTINGFKQFADTFSEITASGPYVKVDLVLTGANFAEVFDALAGGPGHVFDSITDPPLYTAADCPRYDGANGPNCTTITGHGTQAQLLSTGAGYGGASSSVGSRPEVAAVTAAASTITGMPQSSIPGSLTDLLLGPLLRGRPTVLR